MLDLLVLDLVNKKLTTNQIVLTIGYDIENLTNPDIASKYKGEVTIDFYGRQAPKHAHGTANLTHHTSSHQLIEKAVLQLFDRIINPDLLVRRVNISANRILPDHQVSHQQRYEQLDLFSSEKITRQVDEQSLEKEKNLQKAILDIKKKYGKSSVMKGMNLEEGATTLDRNEQIGGHKA